MSIKIVRVDATQVNGIKIGTKSRQNNSLVDQPPTGGGRDLGPNPQGYLLNLLASCIVTIGYFIAKQRHLLLRTIEVHVEGQVDPDIFLKKNCQSRSGFSGVRVHTKFDADRRREERIALLHDIDVRHPISDQSHLLTPIEFEVE